jgi:cardiolipin synthase
MVELRGERWRWAAQRIRGVPGPTAKDRVRVLLSNEQGARRLRRRYTRAFARARKSVRLAQAYFLPDRHLIRALVLAARRGVKVELLLPGESDLALVPAATRRIYRRLLAAGIVIHEWRKSVLHAKLGLIDGERLLVGSFNLDPLSMVNLEVLLELGQPEVVDDAVEWFEAAFGKAVPIGPSDCERGGLRGFWDNLMGTLFVKVARLIRRLISREPVEPSLPPPPTPPALEPGHHPPPKVGGADSSGLSDDAARLDPEPER